MIGRIFTVGGFTFLSRLTGFGRDVVLASVLGAGPIADAFFVALRLPNHFRAIFAEGAFNAAFVPAYARIHQQAGGDPARLFAGRVLALLLAAQLILLVVVWLFMPSVVGVLAWGLRSDPERFPLAVELTRITFPYLLMISVVTLYSGILNSLGRFATPAAAPILLNLSMILALALAAFFPTAGHAAAWGVLIAGVLEALLVGGDVWRSGDLPRLRRPRMDAELTGFLKRLGPAVVGAGETQIALFADTMIASFLATGAISALYYADRLNQLPVGVIGVAVGTVLLPEMANRIAAGDERGARHAQNRAVELSLLLAIPCFVAFLIVPELIMRALFGRGAFTDADAAAAGATLAAYAIGLFPFVLLRSASVTFLARGDTLTPVKALAVAVTVNVALKILLMDRYAQVGLALATSVGAWINFALLIWFARRKNLITIEPGLVRSAVKLALAGVALAATLAAAMMILPAGAPAWRAEMTLAALGILGAVVYFGLVLAMFGRQWLTALRRRPAAVSRPAGAPPPSPE